MDTNNVLQSSQIDFEKQNGLIPAIIQDSKTMRVLMLGFMNQEAFEKTQQEGKVTFFSRTKNRLWTKGETSENFLYVEKMHLDCDNDTLLIFVRPEGEVCHKGEDTCFGKEKNTANIHFLQHLENTIEKRSEDIPENENSYTRKLLNKGVHKVAQKVGEEAVEVVIDAMRADKERFKEECGDLLYHLLVLMRSQDVKIDEVMEVLEKRHK
ncbi:bifunctional phosphoribosyl-AMP cyclohydrolase/phosphoribosyl-ATP diphosphatase HisIE [Bernardetia sp.]|uniref:bifunctional phosphoribosyl-AMP cyclohydrolase/phosphoribosyl-ATP diphosphatase HisIE n=1 Tax=Bernardetia sp. TaxID=1937974 RepID=UPI0025BE5C02|nr:bifunctional phosphoribosyl-AMP cyclohydrolase/phosphoribosyl-ATP diphosphatase HisIE [Bernardetia sp.]